MLANSYAYQGPQLVGQIEDYLKLLNHKPVTCGDARGKERSE
jgi:hypothetical protein